ncbi:MAG TPA: SDR family NAD(P)-dependent oxidoreductase [Tabrizicola sp.]|nr:SDR family NAD(P)-dependent oxidoreductase [Tabrizicola sp.]
MADALKRIVIVGATSAMAEQAARLWAERGPCAFVLVGRDAGALERIAQDLRLRRPGTEAHVVATSFITAAEVADLMGRISALGLPDVALIAHGSLTDQKTAQEDLQVLADSLSVNGTSACLLAEGFAGMMAPRGYGHIGVIGSVAGDRGRKTNYAYGAAKGLVDRYVQGMQHRLARTKIMVTLIKPGPTATPMTAHLDTTRMAPVADVAANIVAGIEAGRPVVYTPGKWRIIMMVIRHMPRFIFNRLEI